MMLCCSDPMPATSTATATRRSSAPRTVACQPPPDHPVTPSRRGSTRGEAGEIVQAAAHGQVEEPECVTAHEVEMRGEVVRVAARAQLSEARPLQIEDDDSHAGEGDAAPLRVLGRLSAGS